MRCLEKAQQKRGAAKLQRRVAMNGGARLMASPGIRGGSWESKLTRTPAPQRTWVASFLVFACMGTMNLELCETVPPTCCRQDAGYLFRVVADIALRCPRRVQRRNSFEC